MVPLNIIMVPAGIRNNNGSAEDNNGSGLNPTGNLQDIGRQPRYRAGFRPDSGQNPAGTIFIFSGTIIKQPSVTPFTTEINYTMQYFVLLVWCRCGVAFVCLL